MLTKIKRIESIGKFRDFSSEKGLPPLKRETVIYAPNGYGKSTFTAILRSLGEGNAGLLLGRKSLGPSSPPFVALSWEEGADTVYKNGAWQSGLPEGVRIAIFDADYIRDNLFSSEITTDHRRSMCGIILGREGLELKQDLDKSQETAKAARKIRKEFETEKKRRDERVGGKDYLTIPNKHPKEEVESRANALEKLWQAKQEEEKIRRDPRPEPLIFQAPEVRRWAQLMAVTTQEAHVIARQRVQEQLLRHFAESESTGGESFIFEGFKHAIGTCPFCGQDLAGAQELMDAYKAYFDEAYNEQKRTLAKLKQEVDAWNPDTLLANLRRAEETSRARSVTWLPRLTEASVPPLLTEDWEAIIARWRDLYLRTKQEVATKYLSPEHTADPTPIRMLAEMAYDLQHEVTSFNAALDDFRNRIDGFISEIGGESVEEIRLRMDRARPYVDRFTPEAERWCSEYKEAMEGAEKAEEEERRSAKALADYSDKKFEAHQERMNCILREVGADFRIGKLEAKVARNINSAVAEFSIVIDDVATSSSTGKDSVPNFRNTLSEGDRNCLALAFFLSSLEQGGDIERTVLVLDDPLSSLDHERLSHATNILRDVSSRTKQTVILTHDVHFLSTLPARCIGFANACYLEIVTSGNAGSKFAVFDMGEHQKHPHRRTVERLKRYQHEGEAAKPDDVQKEIRKALEHVLQIKYCTDLEGADTLGGMITALERNGFLTADVVTELRFLNETTAGGVHRPAGAMLLSDSSHGEVRLLVPKALDLLKRL